MAVLARRTWSQLLSELVLMAGGHDYTGYSDRCKHALANAYFELCARFHHYELDRESAFSVSTTRTYTLPTDLFVIVSVVYDSGSGGPYFILNPAPFQSFIGERWERISGTATDRATKYARFGSAILLDGPRTSTVSGTIYYYAYPTAPDFDVPTYPTTAVEWDEHILELACAKMQRKTWRPDLAMVNAQLLEAWLGEQVRPSTTDQPLTGLPGRSFSGTAMGGKQG